MSNKFNQILFFVLMLSSYTLIAQKVSCVNEFKNRPLILKEVVENLGKRSLLRIERPVEYTETQFKNEKGAIVVNVTMPNGEYISIETPAGNFRINATPGIKFLEKISSPGLDQIVFSGGDGKKIVVGFPDLNTIQTPPIPQILKP